MVGFMKLHFPKDWLRKISKEDLDGDDVPIGRPDAWQSLGPPPSNGTAEERELDAMTYAFPPNKGRLEFILGMVATFGFGFFFVTIWFVQFFFTATPQDLWMAWMNLAMGGALVLIGIFAVISRKRDQDYRKKMVLEHEAYMAAQLKDRLTASTIH
jgi:hypothetical protein